MKLYKQQIKRTARRVAISTLAMIQLMTFVGFGEMIDENTYEIPISRGVNHKRIIQTYENGVKSIDLTIADMGDQALGLDLLYNKSNGFVNRQELSVLSSQNPNAVVSINGDFFNMGTPSYATGIMVDKGKMISSPSYKNGEMAAMMVDGSGNVQFDYLSSGVLLTNDATGDSYNSLSINKHSTSFTYPIIFTREYRNATIGSTDKLSLTEMVVDYGAVKEIRTGQGSTPIPANGFVVIASGAKGSELSSKFSVGDRVSLSSSAQQAYSGMVTALGGGTLILRDGQNTPITHQVKGKSQRTAIGVTYDNKLLFMVTDGRTGAYIGMDENDVADFLKTQNVKDAMMLDGGGSSELIINGVITNNMVAKERKILNGLSVVNNNPKGGLAKLEAVLETQSIVQGDQVKLVVQGFDSSMNPVKLGAVSVKGSGVNVRYSNGYITAVSGGSGTITVSSGTASTSIPIQVAGINPTDPKLKESTGQMDVAIVPNGSWDKQDALGQVLNGKIVEKSSNAKLAVNMFNKNQDLSNALKPIKESIAKGGQIISSNGITMVGLSTNKGIGGTAGQWSAVKQGLNDGNQNVLVMLSGSFQLEPSEKRIFRKLVSEASKSKNIFVISTESKFESHAEGNVSYIGIMDNATAKGSVDTDFRMLSFRNEGGKMLYSFEKLF